MAPLVGCLERVTDTPVPLDPRYYEGHAEVGEAQGSGDGTGGATPWADAKGARRTLRVIVASDTEGTVQLDVGEYDATSASRTKRVGTIQMAGPDTQVLEVPATVDKVLLQAFQDLDGDGPTDADPFGTAEIAMAGTSQEMTLKLVKGARAQPSGGGSAGPGGGAPSATPAPPGAPGGGPGGGTSGGVDTLVLPAGPRATLYGTIQASRDLPVVLDVFSSDPVAPGGRIFQGRVRVKVGAFSVALSRSFKQVEIEAYQDLTGDSRTNDDPATRADRPVDVSAGDASGLVLVIP